MSAESITDPADAPGWGAAAVVAVSTLALITGSALLAGGPDLQGYPAALWLGLGALAVQWIAWVPAARARTEHYYDLVGSLTYLGCVIASAGIAWCASHLDARGALVALLVVVWAGRLGLFLFTRVLREGKDGRFDELKRSPARFWIAWTLQGLWVFWTGLAAWILILHPTSSEVGLLDRAGLALWVLGFGIEVVADAQKRAFRADPANRDRWIDTGLWAWSRHPNYLGEILLWTGIAVIGAGQFEGPQWVGLLSPVFVTLLLTRGSGIPLLEEGADARWGDDPAYRQYRDRVPVLVPGF